MARTKGTRQLNAEINEVLIDQFKKFCESRGETFRENLEMAMRRHMANPPPPVVPMPPPISPLPPVTAGEPVTVAPAPKKTAIKRGKK